MSKVRPIKPSEVTKAKQAVIPEVVFEAFNELIASNFDGHSATFKLWEVGALLKAKGVNLKEASEKNWLDVEAVYRKAGWRVKYDSPAYCENYEPFFVFSK